MLQRSALGLGWGVPKLCFGVGLLVLVLIACHDAPRDNPFDPTLTPPVEWVSAVVDTTSGTVTLEWTAYSGQ